MVDSPEIEEGILWTNVIKDSASCVEDIVEKVANRIGGALGDVYMANFEIKFYKEEYAQELIMYNDAINKWSLKALEAVLKPSSESKVV